MVAAAHASPFQCPFSLFFYFFLACFCIIGSANDGYTRQNRTDVGVQYQTSVSSVFHHAHNIPDNTARPAGSPWIVIRSRRRRRQRRGRKQKRRRRSGVMLRLKAHLCRGCISPVLDPWCIKRVITTRWKSLRSGLLCFNHDRNLASPGMSHPAPLGQDKGIR